MTLESKLIEAIESREVGKPDRKPYPRLIQQISEGIAKQLFGYVRPIKFQLTEEDKYSVKVSNDMVAKVNNILNEYRHRELDWLRIEDTLAFMADLDYNRLKSVYGIEFDVGPVKAFEQSARNRSKRVEHRNIEEADYKENGDLVRKLRKPRGAIDDLFFQILADSDEWKAFKVDDSEENEQALLKRAADEAPDLYWRRNIPGIGDQNSSIDFTRLHRQIFRKNGEEGHQGVYIRGGYQGTLASFTGDMIEVPERLIEGSYVQASLVDLVAFIKDNPDEKAKEIEGLFKERLLTDQEGIDYALYMVLYDANNPKVQRVLKAWKDIQDLPNDPPYEKAREAYDGARVVMKEINEDLKGSFGLLECITGINENESEKMGIGFREPKVGFRKVQNQLNDRAGPIYKYTNLFFDDALRGISPFLSGYLGMFGGLVDIVLKQSENKASEGPVPQNPWPKVLLGVGVLGAAYSAFRFREPLTDGLKKGLDWVFGREGDSGSSDFEPPEDEIPRPDRGPYEQRRAAVGLIDVPPSSYGFVQNIVRAGNEAVVRGG